MIQKHMCSITKLLFRQQGVKSQERAQRLVLGVQSTLKRWKDLARQREVSNIQPFNKLYLLFSFLYACMHAHFPLCTVQIKNKLNLNSRARISQIHVLPSDSSHTPPLCFNAKNLLNGQASISLSVTSEIVFHLQGCYEG